VKPLDCLRQELLNLEGHLAVAGLALLEAEESAPPEEVRLVLGAFGYQYKSLQDFLRDHGEVLRWHRDGNPSSPA